MTATRALLVTLLLGARVAAADAQADAERSFNEGQAAYDDKRYDDAIAAWQKSYELSHLPDLVFNLAQAHRLAGHCSRAVESYRAFIQADPTSAQRADAESRLKEIQPCPAPAPVPAAAPVIAPTRLVGHPAAAQTTGGHPVGGGVLVGVGAALAITGAVFGAQAASAASDVSAACARGCEWTSALHDKESTGQTDQTLQYALYGAGAAAVIAGVIVWRIGRHEHVPAVTVVPRADGAQLSFSGSF